MGKIKHLIVDANAFLKNLPLQDFGEQIITLDQVVSEIRDKATKQRLKALPYTLEFKQPFSEYVQLVTKFAKATGDYPSLSAVDIRLMALTYQLTEEKLGNKASQVLKKNPEEIHVEKEVVLTGKPNDLETADPESTSNEICLDEEIAKLSVENEEVDSDSKASLRNTVSDNNSGEETGMKYHHDSSNQCDEDEDDDLFLSDSDSQASDSDEEGWITPSNLKEKIRKYQSKLGDDVDADLSDHPVACLTSDFAMQNTMMHMGLKVLSPSGLLIKHLRTFILRCYACYHTTSIMTKVFCPKCGYKTLKKVAVSYDKDGKQVIHLSSRVVLSKRGKIFPLPKPSGGKHAVNPILSEDQRIPHQRPSKLALSRVNPMDDEYIARSSPFATKDIYSRAAMLGINSGYTATNYWDRRNPNEPRKSGKRSRKK